MSRPRWRNPDKRRAHAVVLRGKGWSLRQIGAELGVTEGTVRNDLRKAEVAVEQSDDCVIPLRNYAGNSARLRRPITQQGEEAG